MDTKKTIALLIGLGAGAYLWAQKDNFPTSEDMQKIASAVNQKYAGLASQYSSLGNPVYSLVETADILAVICRESGRYVLAGKAIPVGDLGAAVGLMQVHKIAWQDVFNNFGITFSYDDCKISDEANIATGAGYLQLCLKSAFDSGLSYNDAKFLAYRKYNAGYPSAKPTNTIATDYATAVLNFRNALLSL